MRSNYSVQKSEKPNVPIFLRLMLLNILVIYIVLLINLWEHPSTGYELSIYHFSRKFVVFIIIFETVLLLLISANLINNVNKPVVYIISMLLLFSFMILPILRGYPLYGRGDSLTHFGRIKDILSSGHITYENYYPVVHVLVGTLSLVAEIKLKDIFNISPAYFGLLYIIGEFIIVRHLFSENEVDRVFPFIIITSLLYMFNFVPEGLSLLYLPFAIYILARYLSTEDSRYRIILLILLVLYLLFHPAVSLFILLALILFVCTPIINKPHQKIKLELVILNGVALAMWIINSRIFKLNLLRLMRFIKTGLFVQYAINTTKVASAVDKLSIVKIFIFEFSVRILLILLSLLGIILNIKGASSSNYDYHKRVLSRDTFYIFIIIAFGLTIIGTTILFFLPLLSLTPFRLLNYCLPFIPALYGITLVHLLNQKRKLRTIIKIILVIMLTISFIGHYSSPYEFRPNWQITYEELMGTQYFNTYSLTGIKIYSIGISYRFFDATLGKEYSLKNWIIPKVIKLKMDIPPNSYILISEYDLIVYTKLWPNVRFSKRQFEKYILRSHIIYSNNGFFIMLSSM